MANYYTTVTANEEVKCSRQEFDVLAKSLGVTTPLELGKGQAVCATHKKSNLSLEFYPQSNALIIYGSDFNLEELPAAFLKEFGKQLKRHKLKFLEFGIAFTCDKKRPGSHGGSAFRITDKGKYLAPKVIWPEQ